MRTAFITFIYPAATKFFDSFIQSLANQTEKDFKLIVFNDGCKHSDLKPFLENNIVSVEIIDNTCVSISENRFRAFCILEKSEYENFIFGDIDDLFSDNRIELVKKALANNEIVFNELHLINEDLSIIKPELVKGFIGAVKEITFEMVKYQNLIGFSHLAMRKQAISFLAQQPINRDITVVDWVIVTKLLTKRNAYFETNAITYYMMHENNIALESNYSYRAFLQEVEVKLMQYKENEKLDESLAIELANLYNVKQLITENKVTESNWENLIVDKINVYYPWWNKLKCGKELKDEIQIRRNKKL